jgi:hypothetical protein
MAKGKAKNQKDTDSTYTNTGGFQFTLPDEVRFYIVSSNIDLRLVTYWSL